MSVDFDAIARSGRCDVSSLRLALPLLEQGYTPPFLARYRTDELSGVDEATLWALARAINAEQQLAARREELRAGWEKTSLCDPAIGQAINKANTARVLTRLAGRLKSESNDPVSDATRLASRILNPRKGDGSEVAQIASKVEGISDAAAAAAGLDEAIAARLMGDPRMIATATRWLAKNAKIHIESISDPHGSTAEQEGGKQAKGKKQASPKQEDQSPANADTNQADQPHAVASDTTTSSQPSQTEADQPESSQSEADKPAAAVDASASETVGADATSAESSGSEPVHTEAIPAEQTRAEQPGTESSTTPVASPQKPVAKSKEPAPQKSKKISPRQRRRRWLVSVLKPLAGKRFKSDKLSAFQIVMLGRALRSQVAKCAFQYDATRLVKELQKTASGFNRPMEGTLREWVLQHEADIREAAESAWWNDLAERASARLVNVTSDHLRRHVNRGGVDANVVMSIDAVGPRTAAAAIVTADGRVLHCEDIPCQLSTAQRSQAVTKMGELIHNHHVDLIVISNGPARRATMIALSDLIKQSPEKSIRWTLSDRSGADAYSGSSVANQEMRSTPRRFRAAAWLAFSILQPAQAITKVDPLKLRLSSFQRELSDDAILGALVDVLVSGTSRGGVDVNSAPASWLARLPGMTAPIAEAIDSSRRKSLFASREAIAELEEWESVIQSRQAIPFLRVFGSEEVLDGTLVHPEDYALARKLAKSLEIELPPNSPPGYSPPKFDTESEPSKPAQLTEVESQPQPPAVEDFSSAENEAPEFQVGEAEATEGATEEAKQTETSAAEAAETAAIDTETSPGAIAETETAGDGDQDAEVAVESDAEQSVTAELGGQSDPAAATEVEPDSSTSDPTDAGEASTTVAAPEIHPSVKRPIPEKAKIDKCVKEWQIGSNRANQIVHWLCDPFGDSDASGTPPAVLSYMPATKELKPGDPVIGVVVSVMPFGVFVELAPDCSGLIHVSRISESFVEDLHEAVQVGDVVTAWVIGTDEKRRRVALSAISPERAQELEEQRHARSDRGRFRDTRQTRPGPRGDKRGQTSGGDRSQGGRESAGKAAAGAAGRGGRGKPQGKSNDGRRDRGRQGGRGQGGGRDRGRGGRGRERKPESYRVESKEEVKPISEEMQQGKEPMRTFGDLAQFFGKPETADKPTADQAAGKPIEQAAPPEQPANPPEAESTSESAPKPDSVTAPESVPVQGAAQEPEPTAEFSSESTPKVSPSVTETAAESPDSESSSPDSAATDAQTS